MSVPGGEPMTRGSIVLMRVKRSTWLDIKQRLEQLGPPYTSDFIIQDPNEGPVLVFGEVGFVPEPEPEGEPS